MHSSLFIRNYSGYTARVASLVLAILTSVSTFAADKVTVTISNRLDAPRLEMAEVNMQEVLVKLNTAEVVVTDADGRELASQQTYDGKLIFQVGVAAKGKSVYYVKPGKPSAYEPKVFGRQFPERVDDIAWENDRVAFRCYGPALQKSGERAWGYDVWNKNTSRLVVEERYRNELDPNISAATRRLRELGHGDLADDVYNAVSYHVDHGTGMDCYKVGPTLGCGTPALLTDNGGTIAYPRCYKDFKILDNGPLRFTVQLTYGTESVDGMDITETRIVSLDAGNQLNRTSVTYQGMTHQLPVAVGIIVHNENPTAYVMNQRDGYMGYEDLGDPNQYKEKYRAVQNKTFGQIYVGAVFPQPVTKMQYKDETGLPGATGHILAVNDKQQNTLTYYFGSGWSRNAETGFNSLAAWEAYLNRFARQVRNPLKITLK